MSKDKSTIKDLVGNDGKFKPFKEYTSEEQDRVKAHRRESISLQQKVEIQRVKRESLQISSEKLLRYRQSIRDILSDVIVKSGGRGPLTWWETAKMFVATRFLPKGFVIEFAEPETESVDTFQLKIILSEMWAEKIAETPKNVHAATCTTTLQVEELDAQGKIVINPNELSLIEAEVVKRGLHPKHSIAEEN